MTQNAIDFGIWWGLISKLHRSYVLMGPKGVGKSVAIDLLTDKVMTHQEADDTEGSVVVEDENYECIYPSIYFQQFKDLLFLEGFTLGDKLKPLDIAKVVFFKETVLAA